MEKQNNNAQKTSKPASAQTNYRLSEYARQLEEKQKVKDLYGLREKQFRRFFDIAVSGKEAPGEALLSLLERRLDNVLYRSKLASTRSQARQIIVHGHVTVNNKKVYSPSYLIKISDEVSLAGTALSKSIFIEKVVDKRLNTAAKVPDWIELDKKNRKGKILRFPVRSDIQAPIEEHLIVELYSK